ncbi:right-handed parallel beta-helix repeat-containing protein [Streptomyces sp. NPDC002668]|uniref:DUF7910 domain-containing protein n=1 Tax=Streptomyces sp. NPDC002668 TaxID=3154422 RepID=UPI0033258BA6
MKLRPPLSLRSREGAAGRVPKVSGRRRRLGRLKDESAGTVARTAALIATVLLTNGLLTPHATAAQAACIPSGTNASIQTALAGPGAVAELCAGSVFDLSGSIVFTDPGQTIQTQGLPTDSSQALLRVTGDLATAIRGGDKSNVMVQNIRVDGRRSELGRVTNGEALLEMGGRSTGQIVQNTALSDPRGWSALHMTEGGVTDGVPTCQNSKIVNNTIGPSGEDTGAWADGISLACGNSEVAGNTVTDATDGGIVIFGAPGSQVRNNTITARTRVLLGGINMVDFKPMNGNYTGTTVSGNTIDAAGSLIKIAVAMGTMPWGCGSSSVNYGATVTGNTLTGTHMGYGFVASGVQDWTVTGNTDRSTHVGYPSGSNCSGTLASPPRGFQSENVAGSSSLQSDFVPNQHLTNLLKVSETPAAISLLANNGKFVTAENEGTEPLIANRTSAGLWEKFDVTRLSGDQVQLRARANSKWVTAEDAGASPLIANRATPRGWETLHLFRNGDGTVSLVACNNLYVSSNNGNAPLVADRAVKDAWERFTTYAAS